MAQEVDEKLRLRTFRPEVDVGDEERPELSGRDFGHGRLIQLHAPLVIRFMQHAYDGCGWDSDDDTLRSLWRRITMDLGIRGRKAIVCASSKGLGKGCALA